MLCSIGLIDNPFPAVFPVVAVLTAVTVSCLIQIVNSKIFKYVLCLGYIICCMLHASFLFMLPLIVYDICKDKLYPLIVPAAGAMVLQLAPDGNVGAVWTILAICTATVVLELRSAKADSLEKALIITRDNAVEYSNELIRKNKQIIEGQDNELHLATLKERNRIAREIHDNVGHMLTRTILQMGAIQIINKDEDLKEPLESVKTTLDDAMNSIRKSVHDLHDDSIDLESSLREAIAPLRENFAVHFDYDVSGHMNGKIKYCFIAIVKEASNNIIKHSKGDTVNIIVREHPAMYTLNIDDNGNCANMTMTDGIGLENMRDRVSALGGVLNINADRKGFRIIVSIMKKNRDE